MMLRRFTAHLFYKIGLLVVLFSILLTVVIFYTVDYYYTEQDTVLDAQELYFYGDIINRWDFPDDSIEMKKDKRRFWDAGQSIWQEFQELKETIS